MLQCYEQQLLAARRLVRMRARMQNELDPKKNLEQGFQDPSPEEKRNSYKEDIARHIFNDLLYTGSNNPVIEEIRQELSEVLGITLRFTYPPGRRLCIVKESPNGPMALTPDEIRIAKTNLYRITKKKINASLTNATTYTYNGVDISNSQPPGDSTERHKII